MLIRRCSICNKKLPYGIKCKCEIERDKSRYRDYKKNRMKDKDERRRQQFYNSKEWIRLRDYIKLSTFGIDIYEWYKTGKVFSADTYHHIVTAKDDWSMRLDINNIIGLSNSSHRIVHNEYDKGNVNKAIMQKELRKAIRKFKDEFGI